MRVQPRNVLRVTGICAVLALMVWGVFARTLSFDFVNYDDFSYVTKNPLITGGISWAGIVQIFTTEYSFYHPLTTLSHMLDHQLYGLNPAGFHATNVVLHTLSVLLLFLILRAMTGSLWRSAFVAAVFAIHPLRVESVAWISERKDVLSGLFFMLTLGAYVRYVRRPFSIGRYGLVFLCLVASLLSKGLLVTIPFLFLVLDYWPLKRFRHATDGTDGGDGNVCLPQPVSRLVAEKIPFFLLSVGMCFVMILSSSTTIASTENISLFLRLSNAVVSYVRYIVQSVVPANLTVFYPYPDAIPLWKSAGAFLFLGAVTLYVVRGFRKRPALLAGWLWYLGVLVPVIGLVQSGAQGHADRYTYIAQIGLVIAACWWTGAWATSLTRRRLLSVLAGIILAVLMISATIQTAHWRNSLSLWTHALACTDRNDIAHNNMGEALAAQDRFHEAIGHHEQALQINPNDPETHYNMGAAFVELGRLAEAVACDKQALRLRPDFAEAHNNLGIVLAMQGKPAEAIEHYRQTLRLRPDLPGVRNNLGLMLQAQGKLTEAIAVYRNALELTPDSPRIHVNIGNAWVGLGKFRRAIEHYRQTLRLSPDSLKANNNLAWLLATCPDAEIRDGKRAVELALRVNRLSGGTHSSFLDTLAAAYAEAGQYPEAVETARRALKAADAQGTEAGSLRKRLDLYRSGLPFHDF